MRKLDLLVARQPFGVGRPEVSKVDLELCGQTLDQPTDLSADVLSKLLEGVARHD